MTRNIQRYVVSVCSWCIWIYYMRGNNWWVMSKMFSLSFIKILFSLKKNHRGFVFWCTWSYKSQLSTPADSLMRPIEGRPARYWKCRHSARGVIRSLSGLILQMELSFVITTVTALLRTLTESLSVWVPDPLSLDEGGNCCPGCHLPEPVTPLA